MDLQDLNVAVAEIRGNVDRNTGRIQSGRCSKTVFPAGSHALPAAFLLWSSRVCRFPDGAEINGAGV